MSDLLSAATLPRLIGVIDLLHGRAVHAVAGRRDRYQPVISCAGNPLTLRDDYSRLGVSQLYIADLDAIAGGPPQFDLIDQLCGASAAAETLIDIGWTGDRSLPWRDDLKRLAVEHPHSLWIAATESASSGEAIDEFAALVGPQRTLLGLDYRRGELIANEGDESNWIDRAMRLGLGGAVVLDLSSVGTSRGPATIEICGRIRGRQPGLPIFSGGGIRSAGDVRMLIEAGCDRCLVATALHGLEPS